ncbi:sulfite exporter TauE/SafE family protein [Helicobacter mesocricetorum]|uniref:sulfite exporter TauE/SafE family protein n=1 Tax=Helicobacter mesocricetorum TaxID=87012 RepID=UPI000CF0BB4C|nr:sulfite exporter TauE/SafE family protein [Helicobacter mesocricetorum]
MEILAFDSLAIILVAIGLFTGAITGCFGIGGGVIVVPMMVLLGNDIKVAIGISIMQMMFSSFYGTYVNYKQSHLDFKDGFYVGIGGLFGAAFSGAILDRVSSDIISVIFTLFLLYNLMKLFKINAYGGEVKIHNPLKAKIFLVGCGILVGIFAISLGIGGGMILTPLLAYYLGYSSKKIIPIALFFIIFSSLSGFISLSMYGYVDYKQGFIVGIASLIGVRMGIWILNVMDAKKHKYMLVILYIAVLSVMIKENFDNFGYLLNIS